MLTKDADYRNGLLVNQSRNLFGINCHFVVLDIGFDKLGIDVKILEEFFPSRLISGRDDHIGSNTNNFLL